MTKKYVKWNVEIFVIFNNRYKINILRESHKIRTHIQYGKFLFRRNNFEMYYTNKNRYTKYFSWLILYYNGGSENEREYYKMHIFREIYKKR